MPSFFFFKTTLDYDNKNAETYFLNLQHPILIVAVTNDDDQVKFR